MRPEPMERTAGGDRAEPALDFMSADSVPAGFAVDRPLWLTPLFLVTVALTSALVIWNTGLIGDQYKELLASINQLPDAGSLGRGSLGFRPFFAMLIVLVGLFSGGPVLGRLRFTLLAFGAYSAGVIAADSVYLRLESLGTPPPFSAAGNVTAGFIGVLVMAIGVFSLFYLPADTVVHTQVNRSLRRYFFVLLFSMAVGAAAVFIAFTFAADFLNELREVALLGGLGPGLALFLPTVLLTLFLIGWVGVSFGRAKRWVGRGAARKRPQPDVAFLVAAFNEAGQIKDCIRALDSAAARYRGRATLYIVDNGSEDDTVAIAERAIGRCEAFGQGSAQVLHCPARGKSHALNFGLERISEEIVVRVDADTVVEPSLLEKAVPYFTDPAVGGVTGMPLPKRRFSVMGLMRTIEVYHNVGFNRVAESAIDAVMVLPGIMSAYRRDALARLGGFAEGINGEDTDMSVRIGRLGYRLLVDPSIRMYTEVPESLSHLREQRLRWSRSLYHVAARNMSAIRMRQGTRGLWVLSWTVYFSSRRLIVLPIIIYALLLLAYEPENPALRQGAAIAAIIVGPQVFVLALTLLLYRQFAYIPLIPGFLVFRLVRSYFAMESFFTLPAAPERVRKPAASPEPTAAAAERPLTAPAGAATPVISSMVLEREPAPHPARVIASRGANGHYTYAGNGTNGHTAGAGLTGTEETWRLPSNHPIRRVKLLTEQTVDWLSPVLERMQAGERELPLDPATAVRASALMSMHGIDDEAVFCDRVRSDRVSIWFMGLDPEHPDLDAGALRASRGELLKHDAACDSVELITRDARRRGLYPGSSLLNGSTAAGGAQSRARCCNSGA